MQFKDGFVALVEGLLKVRFVDSAYFGDEETLGKMIDLFIREEVMGAETANWTFATVHESFEKWSQEQFQPVGAVSRISGSTAPLWQ